VRRPPLPEGQPLHLPGRGTAFVRHVPAPAGAPTVLLLHGLGVTSDLQWFTALPALVARFGIVAVDHRGHGRGIRSTDPFRLEDCADDAAAVLDRLDVDRAIAVGYSMGAPVAQLLWRRHPEVVAGLVSCAGVHSYRGMERIATGRLGEPTLRALQTARAIGRVADPGLRLWALNELRRTDRRYAYEAAVAVGSYDAGEWIGGVDVAHAVVVTEHDVHVTPDRQRAVAAALPGASVHPCDADHLSVVRSGNAFVPALVDALEAVTR
jgi:3-oxoadipate enol-lactonase